MTTRRRSAGFLLALLIGLSACGAAPRAGASADPGSSDASAADDDAQLTFTPEADAAAEGTVTLEDGGTITATASDGTTFELVVPAEAVPGDTDITLTPLSDVEGIEADAAHAVLLEPDGLEFHELARLTITPTEPIPVESQLAFEASGDGADPALALVDPESEAIVILLDHFSVAGIATADEAQRARMLEKSAANAEERLNGQVRARIGEERVRQLMGTGEGESAGSVPREALDAIAAEYQREVIDKRRAAAEESCRALREYVRTVIRWERQWQLAGVGESEEAASQARVVDAVEYAQSRKQECEDEAIAACKDAEDPQVLIDFWLWIDDPVDKKRAEELCEPLGFKLTVEKLDIPMPTWADSDWTLDITGEVLGCPNDDGTWEYRSELSFIYDYGAEDYPGAQSGPAAPEEWFAYDIAGGQLPESLSLVVTDWDSAAQHEQMNAGFNDNVLEITDALGEPTGTITLYDGFDDLIGTHEVTLTPADPECPLPED